MQSFLTRLIEQERHRHTARLDEIARMQNALTLAEPVIQKLEAHLKIALRLDTPLVAFNTTEFIALRLAANRFAMHDKQMHDALLSLGFVEITRGPYGSFDEVILAQDALLIAVTTPPGKRETLAPRLITSQNRRHYDWAPI
jgi:hypothetical protein